MKTYFVTGYSHGGGLGGFKYYYHSAVVVADDEAEARILASQKGFTPEKDGVFEIDCTKKGVGATTSIKYDEDRAD